MAAVSLLGTIDHAQMMVMSSFVSGLVGQYHTI